MAIKKVLVTGGNGYIGSRLCLHLANQGYAVTPLCYPESPTDKTWLSKMDKVLVGDIRDDKLMLEIAGSAYNILIHLVSLDHHQSNGIPSFVSSVNVTPIWSILDVFSKRGLEKFIYFSTIQVYGTLLAESITEMHETNTQNAYALTHLIGELICNHYNNTSSTDCRIVRLSNSYGAPIFKENNCWWLVVNEICKMAFYQQEIVLQSDGTPKRDFIHGWDVCRAVQSIIETSAPHTIYNISSGKTLSIMEIAIKVQKLYTQHYGKQIEIKVAASSIIQPSISYQIDNSLIRSIGFEPKWDLEQGILDFFKYFEQNNER